MMHCACGWIVFALISTLSTVGLAIGICTPKTIKVYIEWQPPLYYTHDEWRNYIMAAMQEWYGRLGYRIQRVHYHSEADISFFTSQLGKNLGQTLPHPYPAYPHLPRKGEGVRVTIDKENQLLYQTLLHEIGHTLGIGHRPKSIMQVEFPRPLGLTPQDIQTIESLKGIL